ncbi:MAG: DCC1-like thiol-disulfide oxidoreductase family protein [Planctomycetota bacterium]|nr:DCC1-like thiol-disulfide oxidoreductase family protein [Planctomycetota bacterium]
MRPLRQRAPRGCLLYDGSCGLCAALARTAARRWRLRALDQRQPLAQRWLGAPSESAVALRLPDGRLLRGCAVVRWAWRQRWWTWPLAALASAPLARHVFDAAYRWLARHRQALARVCNLRPATGAWRTRLDSNQ